MSNYHTYSDKFTKNKIIDAKRRQQVELNEQIRQEQLELEAKNNASFWERLGATFVDVLTEIGGGVASLFEGVVDIGVGLAGEIGGLFGTDKKWAEDIIKFDATQEWYYDSFEDELTKFSFINDAPIVKDIVRGVGEQLPTIAAVALAPVTGGTSLSALPFTIGATVASASGSGMQQALNEGATYDQALLYGGLKGGVEGLVEFATKGLGKGIMSIGKSVGKSAIKTVAKSTGKIMLEEALSEGVEGVLSSLADPWQKAVSYKGASELERYRQWELYKDALKEGAIGAVVGGITGGATHIAKSKTAGGNKEYSIAQSTTELQTLETKEANLYKNDKLNQDNAKKIENQRQAEIQNISSQLKSMSQEDREKAIKRFGLEDTFDNAGQYTGNLGVVDTDFDTKSLASANINAYSPSLRGKQFHFQPTSNKLSENSIKAKKFVMALDSKAKTVFTDELPKNVKAFYDTKEKTMYLSNDISSNELMGHELTHSLEGTEAYEDLKSYVLDNLKVNIGEENYNELIAKKIKAYSGVNEKQKTGKGGGFVARYEAETEIVADEMGKLLSEAKSIERLIQHKRFKVVRKIWQWIKDTLAKLTKRGDKGTYYQYVKKAEELYAEALKNSVGGITLGQVRANVEDALAELERLAKDGADIDNGEEKEYNDGRYKYKPRDQAEVTREEFEHHYWAKANKILDETELANLMEKIGELKYGTHFEKNADGLYMMPTGNKVVFTDGHYKKPSINFIVEIKSSNETDLSYLREDVYECETRGVQAKDEQFFNYYYSRDFSYSQFEKNISDSNGKNSSRKQKRTGTPDPTGEDGRFALDSQDLWDKLSKEEQAKLYRAIDELHHQDYHKYQLPNGNYLIDVKNKIIETEGQFQRPQIQSIIEFTGFNNQISEARDYIYENLNNGGTIREVVDYCNTVLQEEVATLYQYGDSEVNSKLSGQADNNQQDRKSSGNNNQRTRVSRKTDGSLRYSIERNSDGARLSQEQSQFFEDSKVRDKDGNLLTLYHGTSKADFNVFDISKSKNSGLLGLGFYFTDSLGEAERYSGKKGRVIQSYLNMKNPLYVDLTHKSAIIEKLRDIYDKKFANGEIKETFDVNYYLEDSHYKDRINTKKLLELIKKEGFDGIISKNKGYYVVFNSNQIKSTQNSEPTISDDIRYSLSENVEEEVLDKFKTTYNWKETGYILQNGKRIDLSGRKDGAPGGYRTVDHRDVFDLSYYEEESGTNLMIEFMSRGNIRVIPEYPGINLQVEPTAEQYEQIRSLIDNVAWKEQQFSVDFDDKRGNTIDSLVYENNISARKIINDIKYYFKEGKVPYQSELSQFRYSLETDSDGAKLSEEQSEFFKDSKVRDDYGNLKVVYHGTVDGSFNEFKYDFIGRNGTSEGKGFYFTDDIEYAEAYTGSVNTGMFGYSKEHTTITKTDKSKLFRVYLNICKPLSTEKKTITKSQLTTLIKNMDKTGNNYLSNWGDVQYDGYDNVLRETVNNVYEFNDNDVDLIHELLNGGFMSYNEFYDLLRKTLGYDGIISKEGNRGTFYIVFNSNQIKEIDNKFPSESNDIRYALGGLDNTVEKGYNEHRRNTSVTREAFAHHYWAKANNILDDTDIAVFMRKVGELKFGNYFEQNADGIYMIAVGKDGIDNKVVFTDGDYNKPSINMVVEIQADNETDLAILRELLYEREEQGISQQVENLFKYNINRDFKYNEYAQGQSAESGRFSSQQQNGARLTETTGEDGRFALDSTNKGYSKFSKGQVAKVIAEHTRKRAYSRTDAEQVINTVVAQNLSFGDKYGEISGKTKEQVIDRLWHAYNTRKEGFGLKVIEDIAEYIINNATVHSVFAGDIADCAMETIAPLQGYLRSVDLEGIKGEIAHRFDKKQVKIYSRWGKRKGTTGQSPDQIAQELAGQGIIIETNNPADILFEINDMWENANESLKSLQKEKLRNLKDDIDLQELKTKIRDEFLKQQDAVGHKSGFAKIIEHYTKKVDNLKNLVKDIKRFNKAKDNVVSTIERMRDMFIKNRPAGWDVPESLIKLVKDVAKVETWRNDISKNARQYISQMGTSLDNFVFDDQEKAIFPYRDLITEIAKGEGELTAEELFGLDKFLNSFIWHIKNYGKVQFEGSAQDIETLARQGVRESIEAQSILKKNDNHLNRLRHYAYDNPYERFSEMGLWENNSIMERLFAEMKEGTRKRAEFVRDVNYLYDEFYRENKTYLKDLQKEITIGEGAGVLTLPKRQAMTIYMTSLRRQGRSHLFNQGFDYGVIRLLDNKKSTQGKIVEAYTQGKDIKITQEMIDEIESSFNEADKKFIQLTDTFFNKVSKDAKKETDEKLFGISNIEDDFYFPIKVSSDKIFTPSGQTDTNINQYVLDMGMNKSTKPNASNKITIDGIDNIIAKHINDMSMYYGYAVPLNAYNRIMNKQVAVDGSVDMTANIRSEIQKIDTKFEKYVDKLWKNIQGFKLKEEGFFSEAMDYLRWAGANFALGANPKVWLTQTLSLTSALSEFNPKYVAKGLAHFFGEKEKLELGKYSALMWERMQIGNSIDISDVRNIGSKMGRVGSAISAFSTKPISWMDSNVIRSLWFASQYEVAETKGAGYEFGTEANKKEAGRRLDDVVFRTQQTTDALGRSEWLRSDNEFIKFFRMFTSDAMQLTGKWISAVRRLQVAKRMIKSNNPKLVDKGQAMLKEAKIAVAKSTSAILLNQAMLLAIALAFKWLKGLNDDEEWDDVVANTLMANIVGLIPAGGNIVDLLSGYEPTNMAYTALSNTAKIFIDAYNNVSSIISGEYIDVTKLRALIRKTFINIGRLTGIPVQNLETYVFKVPLRLCYPASREEYDALFQTKSNTVYFNRIQQATQNGDEELADAVINIMLQQRTGKIKADKVMDTTRNLINNGFDVIPKVVGKTITSDGVEYKLTVKQHKNFQSIYGQSNEKIEKMVYSSLFDSLEEGVQAKAINFIYNYYYNLAIEDMLGEDLENKTMLFAKVVPIEELAMAVSQANSFTANYHKSGKVIFGSKKAKVQNFVASLKLTAAQKYMIMGYLGYSNKYGAGAVQSAINKLDLAKTQKQEFYKMCGY